MVAAIVAILGVLGLIVVARWVRSEPLPIYRMAALGAMAAGLAAAFIVAFATGKSMADAVALALLGAALLPMALLAQLRMIRRLTTRR